MYVRARALSLTVAPTHTLYDAITQAYGYVACITNRVISLIILSLTITHAIGKLRKVSIQSGAVSIDSFYYYG